MESLSVDTHHLVPSLQTGFLSGRIFRDFRDLELLEWNHPRLLQGIYFIGCDQNFFGQNFTSALHIEMELLTHADKHSGPDCLPVWLVHTVCTYNAVIGLHAGFGGG